jgi:hypothetical protein
MVWAFSKSIFPLFAVSFYFFVLRQAQDDKKIKRILALIGAKRQTIGILVITWFKTPVEFYIYRKKIV